MRLGEPDCGIILGEISDVYLGDCGMNFNGNIYAEEPINSEIHRDYRNKGRFNIGPIADGRYDNSRNHRWADCGCEPTISIYSEENYEKNEGDFPPRNPPFEFNHPRWVWNLGRGSGQGCFVLKYSPSTALTASGMDSSFRAFRSCSNAFTISSDMSTTNLFIAKLDTLPMFSERSLRHLVPR